MFIHTPEVLGTEWWRRVARGMYVGTQHATYGLTPAVVVTERTPCAVRENSAELRESAQSPPRVTTQVMPMPSYTWRQLGSFLVHFK